VADNNACHPCQSNIIWYICTVVMYKCMMAYC
jgi:hypothetical protein